LLQLLSLTGVYACLRRLWPTACGRDENDRPARMRRARGCDRGRRPSLEAAFFQHAARRRGAHPRAARHRVVTRVLKGVIYPRARGFGGVPLPPEWNAEPIADLGWFLAELRDPASADHGAATPGNQEHDLAGGRVRGGDETLRVREPIGVR